LCPPGTTGRISALLTRFGLPVTMPADSSIEGLRDALDLDKKAVASGLRLILLTGIGRAIINDDSHADEIITVIRQSMDQGRPGNKE